MYNGSAAGNQRPYPTAYIIPKGVPETSASHTAAVTVNAATSGRINYNFLLASLKRNFIEFYEIAPGTTVNVKQYYRTGTSNATTSGVTAGLRAAEDVTFEHGAYVVPMDQVTGSVIASTFEPDTSGSNGYNGSVAQGDSDNSGNANTAAAMPLVFHDLSTRDYPYYRLEADYPREVLPMPYNEVEAFVKKLNGNKNELTIVVFELYGNGDVMNVIEQKFSIDNNAAGTYAVGKYFVYVDTKGNTQVRECCFVDVPAPKK
jgi:hypothetical protein